MDDILARLEHAKKTIIDLEKKKLDLTQEERRLKERYDEEELRFKTTVSVFTFTDTFRMSSFLSSVGCQEEGGRVLEGGVRQAADRVFQI